MKRKNTHKKCFPRIPKSEDYGTVTRKIWQSPEFGVRQIDNTTEFVHRLGFLIPDRVRTQQLASFMMLFTTQTIDIEKELEEAYDRATYKNIPVGRLINGALRSVLTEAMNEIFMKAKKSKDPYAKYMEGGRESFAKAARPRRLPKEDFRNKRAIRLARLYMSLFPEVGKIREFIASYKDRSNEEKLRMDVEKTFRGPWVIHITQGQVLRNLPDIPGHSGAPKTLGGLEWTNRQLRVGITKCLEDNHKEQPSLNANTILEDYIPLGKKLLGIARSPRPR